MRLLPASRPSSSASPTPGPLPFLPGIKVPASAGSLTQSDALSLVTPLLSAAQRPATSAQVLGLLSGSALILPSAPPSSASLLSATTPPVALTDRRRRGASGLPRLRPPARSEARGCPDQLACRHCGPSGPHEALLPRERVGLLRPAPKSSPLRPPRAVPRLLTCSHGALCTCTRRSRAGPACSHAPPARPSGPRALPVTAIVDLLRTASPGSFLGNDFQLPLLFVNGTILHLHSHPFPPSIDQRHRLPRRTDQQPFFPSSLGGTDGRVWWKEQASQGQQARVRILPALPTR